MRYQALAVVVAVLLSAGCGSSSGSAPSSPTPLPIASLSTMTGSWTGTSADTSGQERMSWTITQDSGAMSGTVNVSDASRGMAGSGSVRGNVNGRTASFHMDVPTGGFGGMMSSCAMSMDGQATMSDDGHTLTGTYAGTMAGSMMSSGGMMTQSCGGAMANGQFTLTR